MSRRFPRPCLSQTFLDSKALRIYGIHVRHMGMLLMLISLIEDRKQVKDLVLCDLLRFQRESLNKHGNQFNDNGTKRDNIGGRKNGDGAKGTANSYAHAVKEFASLTNLKVVLAKEGYANIEIKYMGAGTWFSQIIQAYNDFTIDERVTWVEIEGVPCKKRVCICTNIKTVLFDSFKMVYRGKVCWVRAIEVPGWVPDFKDEIEEEYDSDDGSHKDEVEGGDLGNLRDLKSDSDVEEVPESKFEEESNKHTLEESSVRQNNAQSEDPFGIYEVLKKKRDDNNKDVILEVSLKYPPGFTPNEDVDASVEAPDILLEKTREYDDQED
nr:hypothetical protein [Tanacetum cinerariifolium]